MITIGILWDAPPQDIFAFSSIHIDSYLAHLSVTSSVHDLQDPTTGKPLDPTQTLASGGTRALIS